MANYRRSISFFVTLLIDVPAYQIMRVAWVIWDFLGEIIGNDLKF
jgi:hypothetical protein